MNIALDAHYIGTNCGGVETYVYNLIESILKIDNNNKYCLYLSPFLKKEILPFINDNVSVEYLLSDKSAFRTFIDIPFKLSKRRPDIYHGQIFLPPFAYSVKKILTLQDVFFLNNMSWLTIKERIKFKHIYYSVAKADHIITISDFSKKEILKNFNLPEKKISVIYCGVSDDFFKKRGLSASQNIKDKYSLPENYLLYVGRINVRKNILILLKSFAMLKQRLKNPVKLVIAGKPDGKNKNIHKIIGELNLQEDVLFLGYIPYEDLPYIYSLSRLFVFIPFYEGFGLPPLEAMASGIPVIASNIPVFRETLGDAALLVDPDNPVQISSTMNDLLNDKNLSLNLAEKGMRRAGLFKWRDSASKTIEIYNTL